MNWDAIGTISEIVGAVAVVVTLAYLAIQIRQQNSMLQSTSRQALVENDRASIATALEHIELVTKLGNEEELTANEQAQISLLWIMDLRNREFEYFQYKAGSLDDAAWQSYYETLHYTFGTERMRRWWEIVGRESFDSEFTQLVDDFIKDSPTNNSIRDMSSWDNG